MTPDQMIRTVLFLVCLSACLSVCPQLTILPIAFEAVTKYSFPVWYRGFVRQALSDNMYVKIVDCVTLTLWPWKTEAEGMLLAQILVINGMHVYL